MDNQLGMLLSGAFEKDLESKLNNQLKKITLDAIKVKVEIDTDNIKKASNATSELAKEKLRALQATNEENLRSKQKINSTKEEVALNKLLVSNLKTKSQVETEAARAQDKAAKAKERDGIATVKLDTQMKNLTRTAENYYKNNKRLEGTDLGNKLDSWIERSKIKIGEKGSFKSKAEAENELKSLQGRIRAANLEGKNMWESISGKFFDRVKFLANAAAIEMLRRAFKQMIDVVKEIDLAMTELKKVTDLSDATYKRFLDNASGRAQKIGATISDTVRASANFAKMGFSLEDSAELGDIALIYKNVGDFGNGLPAQQCA